MLNANASCNNQVSIKNFSGLTTAVRKVFFLKTEKVVSYELVQTYEGYM